MDNKKSRAIIIIIGLIMAFLFITMMIRISHLREERSATSAPGESIDVAEEELVLLSPTREEERYAFVDVSSQIHTIDEVNLEDDYESHDVEVENTYINTTELLPSVYEAREKITKDRVDTSEFPDSLATEKKKTLEILGAKVSVPAEIFLYNCGVDSASEYLIVAEVEDEEGIIEAIGWNSLNEEALTLSSSGGSRIYVNAINPEFAGVVQVQMLVTYKKDANSTSTTEMTFDVHVEDVSYGNHELRDQNGKVLYLDEKGEQIAYVEDFGRADCFYGEIKTTGWQTIDKKTYYFNSDSWAVTGKQIIGGLMYEFDEEGVLLTDSGEFGIDVSKWNKEIDWEQVAASGVDFAIVRCGFRGSVSGYLVEDPYFRKNVEGALANGIKVGVYFFTQAITEQEAIEEASMAIEMCKDYNITLPIYIDSERVSDGRANGLDKDTRTLCLKAFCETINANGYVGGIYASKLWYYNQLHASELEEYNIWVAQYNTEFTYTGKSDYWQYSSRERIAGIPTYVDVNVVKKQY